MFFSTVSTSYHIGLCHIGQIAYLFVVCLQSIVELVGIEDCLSQLSLHLLFLSLDILAVPFGTTDLHLIFHI